jgi:hypothetical protein
MRYESSRSSKGNVGSSYNNQAEADAQALAMDNNNCSNCSDCFGCSYCSDCSNCSNCSNCFGCSDCSGCSRCFGCSDCYGCSGCSDCSHCSGCYGCSRCSGCSGCSHCSDCFRCFGIIRWSGKKTENLISINGLTWPIATDGIAIQIGCQNHTVARWESFSDAEIAAMDSKALDWWRQWKPTVMAMANHKAATLVAAQIGRVL